MKTKKSILVVGSIAFDSLKTHSGNYTNLLGGSASYFAVSAALLAHVRVVGVVGKDFSSESKNLLLSRKINLDNVVVSSGKTFRWGAEYSKDFNTRKTLYTKLGVFESFSPTINQDGKLSPLVFLGNIQPRLQLDVLSLMNSPQIVVSDTMNLWIDMFPNELKQMISKTDVFLLNHEEAEQLTSKKDIELAAKIILGMGPRVVVIKRGKEGAYIKQLATSMYVPSFPVKKVVDPTGAGDSFAGGLLAHLCNHGNSKIIDAVVTGSAMASFCVEGAGLGGLLLASKLKLNARIKKIKSLI